jgi:hypothetical protein
MRSHFIGYIATIILAAFTGCDPLDRDISILGVEDASTTTTAAENASPVKIIGVRDPLGDQTGTIDANGMLVVFDTTSGQYSIYLMAEQGRPFLGAFRVNINLFDQDLGTSKVDPSFFNHTMADFTFSSPQTMIRLTGFNSRLKKWKTGDRVFTNSLKYTGNPEGVTLFRSSVGTPGGVFLSEEDTIGWQDWAQPSIVRSAGKTSVSPSTPLTQEECRRILQGI